MGRGEGSKDRKELFPLDEQTKRAWWERQKKSSYSPTYLLLFPTPTAAPATATTAADADATSTTTDPNEVASNWAVTSDKSGKTYYYNRVTKKTSWSKPTCMAGAAETKASTTATATATTTTTTTTPPAAKPEWVEAKDPSSGKSYWYNRVTKETTW